MNKVLSIYICLIFCLGIPALAQTKSRIFSSYGASYNPYYSPDTIYDYVNKIGYNKQELLKNIPFIAYGAAVENKQQISEKISLKMNALLRMCNYSTDSLLNRSYISISANPTYQLNKKLKVGSILEFKKQQKFSSNNLGEETNYSLSYTGGIATIYSIYKIDKKHKISLQYSYQDKVFDKKHSLYGSGDDLIPLDNSQQTIGLVFYKKINKKHKVELNINYFERNYSYLPSYDSILAPNYLVPRKYKSLTSRVSYSFKPNQLFFFKPYFFYESREDVYNNYYSFDRIGGGLFASYSYKRFFLSWNNKIQNIQFDKCEAPTNLTPYPVLNYTYFNSSFTGRIKLLTFLDIQLRATYENRSSNANRVSWKYRRPYQTMDYSIGLLISPEKLYLKHFIR